MLQLFVEHSGKTVILKCVGRIVAGEEARELQIVAMAQGARELLLDLSEVDTVDAAGLGVVARLKDVSDSRAIRFKVLNPNARVCELLHLTGLADVIDVCIERPVYTGDPEDLFAWACSES